MMLKVDFQSIKNVGKRPKGIIITCITNWLIKPFTMFGIAYLFFYVVFKSLISAELAEEYLAGAVLLGAAPCTAMVFVWSYLTKGDAAYTLVQVAVIDHIGCFRSYCCFFIGRRWRYDSVGYIIAFSRIVCCHSSFCRNNDPYTGYSAKRDRIF